LFVYLFETIKVLWKRSKPALCTAGALTKLKKVSSGVLDNDLMSYVLFI